MAGPAAPIMAAAYYVPLAAATGRVFFQFASRKAAETFKRRFASAGSVTTRTPPKSATVTTTGSSKGRSIVQDMTRPTTAPSVRARNPNLPAPKAKSGGKGAVATATATGVGAVTASKSTGKSADKPKQNARSTSQGGRSRADVVAQQQRRLAEKSAAQGGGSVLSKRAKKAAPSSTNAVSKAKKKAVATPTPRPERKSPVATPKARPKLYRTINPTTGKVVDKMVTASEHLANLDKFKARQKALKTVKANIEAASKKKGKK